MNTPKPSILLLEDEASIAEAILFIFEREGFDVHWVSTCEEALSSLQSRSFDLAIFDIGLPDGSGLELCKNVRKFSEIPVLFLSARDDEIDRILGLEIGADDYVTKPFSPRELVARVRAILRRSESKETNPSQLMTELSDEDELSIDESACQVWVGEVEIGLTRAEYHLLVTFYKNKGRVLSRDQLLDAVSEDPGAAMDRVIDSHIKSIRAKLRKISTAVAERIETRRGLGYVFK